MELQAIEKVLSLSKGSLGKETRGSNPTLHTINSGLF
jgi:hypothetical protein